MEQKPRVEAKKNIAPLNFGLLEDTQKQKKSRNLLEPEHVYSETVSVGSYKKKPADIMRIVCVSDTHSRQRDIQ